MINIKISTMNFVSQTVIREFIETNLTQKNQLVCITNIFILF